MEAILIKILLPALAPIILGLIGRMLQKWIRSQKDYQTKQEVYRALEIGVAQTQQEVVDALKEAAKDGKLTDKDIDKIRRVAQVKALEVVADDPNVVEAILAMAWNTITGIIDLIVQRGKKD